MNRDRSISMGDCVPMRINLRVAENCGDAIFKALGNEVFQTFGFLMHFVPGVFEDVVQE